MILTAVSTPEVASRRPGRNSARRLRSKFAVSATVLATTVIGLASAASAGPVMGC